MKPIRTSLLALATGCALSGCSVNGSWDQEYACTGEERTQASFADPKAASQTQKTYPLTIDFHLRGGQALAKTYTTRIDDLAADRLTFHAKDALNWLNGTFDKQSQELTLIEERQLDTPLGRQSVRSTAHFTCQAV
ncbi:hypothetical protein [Hydrogenophaga aquatica]